jgi:hypothetical protein
MLHSHRRVSPISRFAANRDPDSRFPAKAGNGPGGFPDSRFRPNRESGIPSPIPGQIGNRGNGNWGFPGPSTVLRMYVLRATQASSVGWPCKGPCVELPAAAVRGLCRALATGPDVVRKSSGLRACRARDRGLREAPTEEDPRRLGLGACPHPSRCLPQPWRALGYRRPTPGH